MKEGRKEGNKEAMKREWKERKKEEMSTLSLTVLVLCDGIRWDKSSMFIGVRLYL